MTDSELTRLEMLTLLCISDRTHSNLMEYMPDKCGQSGQSKDFEPTLKQVGNTSGSFRRHTFKTSREESFISKKVFCMSLQICFRSARFSAGAPSQDKTQLLTQRNVFPIKGHRKQKLHV